jgi:4-hydroxyphenylpyruvate dioxygenase-like putative hemolysin
MKDFICFDVMKDYHDRIDNFRCEGCSPTPHDPYNFRNSDDVLRKAIPMIMENRKEHGLSNTVKGLDSVIINTEDHNFVPAVKELLDFTGLTLHSSLENEDYKEATLKADGSADFIVRCRKIGENPFRNYNIAPKSKELPNTRLETFVFETPNLEKYVDIQRDRGVNFLTEGIIHKDNYSFIQTIPSSFTGNSLGFIQWRNDRGNRFSGNDGDLELGLEKSGSDYLKNIKYLDHSATRLESNNRDAAIVEFMELTNYKFDFAIYVKNFNSITSVARLSDNDYAQVFTSGISPFTDIDRSGPTEKYVHNYGPRVHHVAFHTEKIEDTFKGLVEDGMEFLLELVGSPEEGLKQTFTRGMPSTFLVNEYIHRYGDFDGFFTRSNVTDLTRATDVQ